MQRPKEFDNKVMSYLPALWAKAYKLVKPSKAEDLVQDTLAYVFTHWENFRGDWDAPKSGFYSWLVWQMRSVVSNQKVKRIPIVSDPEGILMSHVSVPANQDHAVDLSQVLERLDTIPFGSTLLQYSAGIDQPDIAISEGVSRQAISLRCQRARDDLINGVSRRRPYKRTFARGSKVAA